MAFCGGAMSNSGNKGGRSDADGDDNLPLATPDSVLELKPDPFAPPTAGAPPADEAAEQFPEPAWAAPNSIESSEAGAVPIDLSVSFLDENAEAKFQVADPLGVPSPRDGSDSDVPEARVGTTIAGRYRIERLIAKGGMGRVYLAIQLPLERQVAIKLLVNQRHDNEFRQRFFLEASTCARLAHRHIVTVHDYGEADNGELFMAMEYLDGVPLSRLIQTQVRLSSERACKIALQVCRALRTAHKTGVVHRDLKPGNVIVLTDEDQDGNDFIKVLDFGLVKAFEGGPAFGEELTKSGTWLGSPRYMAPEQIRCQPVDPRSDIYSLGVILFHMLAGRPPFVGANSMEVLEQHLRDRPPSIADVLGRSDYAPELEVIVERCLRKSPDERYQSMDDLIGDLKAAYRLITGVSIHTESTLPTFAEIADPSLAVAPYLDVSPSTDSSGAPLVTGVGRSAAVSGTVHTPLETLEASRPPEMAMPALYAAADERGAVSASEPASSSTVRWVGLAAIFLLVMFAGFFSVRLLRSSKPAKVQVLVDSKPSGAEVRMNGQTLGQTPLVHSLSGIQSGDYRTFIVRKEGYQDLELRTRIEGEQVKLHAALVPTPAKAVEGRDARRSSKARRKAEPRSRKSSRSKGSKTAVDGRRQRPAPGPNPVDAKEPVRVRPAPAPEQDLATPSHGTGPARPSADDVVPKKAKRRAPVVEERVVKESKIPVVE